MPKPHSLWYEHALVLLADGEWHESEWLIRQMGTKVPPGRALRTNEASRARCRAVLGTRTRLRSTEFLLQAGRRTIVVNVLVKSSTIESKTVGGVRFWRLRRKDDEQ